MKLHYLMLAGALTAGLFAETVVKNSASFYFPTTVGVLNGHGVNHGDAVFVSNASFGGNKIITMSWSIPAKTARGTISIFSITGARVKTFPLSSPQGFVTWDVSGAGKTANGIYFATLSSGTYKKNLQLMICR